MKYLLIVILSAATSLHSAPDEPIETGEFHPVYFDSIRATVNDSTQENYKVKAYRLKPSEHITIDGVLNEPVWSGAEHASYFFQREPYPLEPMEEQTEFAILYDANNIYIGVWCWDSTPEEIIRQLHPRGASSPDDLSFYLDTFHDHTTGYKFRTSPTGVQSDELRYDNVKRDADWNGVWYSQGSIDSLGWYAEIQIPFSTLRFPQRSEHTWGFDMERKISNPFTYGSWRPHLPEWDITTRMSELGHITNIRDINPGRHFELRPYVLGGANHVSTEPWSRQLNVGFDTRISPSPNITADVTINPDFAQVDADIFQINLTRYPTRFKELRPFFTERTNIFNTPLELFYSRRVGAKGDILGGLKLTGKLNHGFEFGVLANRTGSSPLSSARAYQTMEEADYGVLRLKKDINDIGSVGLLYAGKEETGQYNRVLGVDGSFLLNEYNIINAQIATGMTELSTTRNRAYDLTWKKTGDLIGWELFSQQLEPYFEINRIGYIQKEQSRGSGQLGGLLKLHPRINSYGIRRIQFNLMLERETDTFTDDYISAWLQKNLSFEPDPIFGTIQPGPVGDRTLSDGTRIFHNLSHQYSFDIQFLNEMSLSGGWGQFEATEMTGQFSGNIWELSYATRSLMLGKKYAGTIGISGGDYYNFDGKYQGYQQRLLLTGEGRLRYNIITSLEGEYTETFTQQYTQDGRYWRFSSTTTWMFTKDFYFRLHIQRRIANTFLPEKDRQSNNLISGLLSWEYSPGSFFYLSYNSSRESGYDVPLNLPNQNIIDTHTVVLKLSHLLKI